MTRLGTVTSRARHACLIGVVALASVTATACSAADNGPAAADAATHSSVRTSVAWGTCPPLAKGAKRDPREKCGTITVPLDYQHPDGKAIKIAVSEIATAEPGKKRGDLVFNPGGPGLEGLDMPTTMAPALPSAVLEEYDLIGFDPRGVGHSTPMSCGLSDPSFNDALPYPAADGSIEQNVATARAFAGSCAKIGNTLQYFNTANTARDIDRIRAALGVPKISYWGQSYGTYLGSVYTSLFPGHTDRMVLEGSVDPAKAWAAQTDLWNLGMNARFPDAARVAAANNATLGLGATTAQVTETFLALASQLDKQPAPVPGTKLAVNGAMLRAVSYQMLMHNETLAPLTQFWKAAADLAAGKAPTAADAAVLQQVAAGDPAVPGVPADNQVTIAISMICNDVSWSRDVNSYAHATAAARAQFPLSDGMPDNILPCAFWPTAPIEPPVKVTARGPRDVLILQNLRDSATPVEGALGMARELGSRAGLVIADNGGHYVYGTGSTCADQAAVKFLTTGALPAKPLSCPGPKA